MTEPSGGAGPTDNQAAAAETERMATISDIRRERRARRRQLAAETAGLETLPDEGDGPSATAAEPVNEAQASADATTAAAIRGAKRRPRAPRAERGAAAMMRESRPAVAAAEASDDQAPAALLLVDPGTNQRRATKTAARARRKQESAANAVANADVDDHPALGALNRHLNMMMQQLNTAHRVIGRVAAERDALRQQLADLQGIPVEEIKVTTVGVDAAKESRPSAAKDATPRSTIVQRFNYFGGDDLTVVRKRRQMLVLVMLAIAVGLAVAARFMHWAMPTDISKNGLAALPFVGQFMSLFLAGWLLFRVVRVSSKGIRWVFPADDPKRRRR